MQQLHTYTGCFLIVCVRCQQFLTSKTWAEIVRKSEVFKKRDATIFWAIRSLNPVLLLKVRALTTQILFLYAYRCLSKSRYFGVVFGWFSQNSRTYEKTEKGVVCSFLWFESYIKSWLDFLIQWFQMSKLLLRAGAGTFWLDAIFLIRSHVSRASRSDGSLPLI